MNYTLSILDLSPLDAGGTGAQALNNTLAQARHVDTLGYTRYWVAEHHNIPSVANPAPDIMIGQIARITEHLRVGSGGVMLPNHAPLTVVERYRMLEALFPDRIDLGIGRAPGTDQLTALALRRSREALQAQDFGEQMAELLAYATGDFPTGHPFRQIRAVPADATLPPIWLLGSSGYSAAYAGQYGMGLAFASHINPNLDDAVAAIADYRAAFQPSAQFAAPHVIVAQSVVCADTQEEVDDLARAAFLGFLRLRSGRPTPIPGIEEARAHAFSFSEQQQLATFHTQRIVGTPAVVRERLDAVAARTGADELMLTTSVPGHAARLHTYTRIAEVCGLQRVA